MVIIICHHTILGGNKMLNPSYRELWGTDPVEKCSECETGLSEGDVYYEYEGMNLCEKCMLELMSDLFGRIV